MLGTCGMCGDVGGAGAPILPIVLTRTITNMVPFQMTSSPELIANPTLYAIPAPMPGSMFCAGPTVRCAAHGVPFHAKGRSIPPQMEDAAGLVQVYPAGRGTDRTVGVGVGVRVAVAVEVAVVAGLWVDSWVGPWVDLDAWLGLR